MRSLSQALAAIPLALLAGCSGTANTQVDANVQANTQVNQNQTTIINQTIIQQQQQNVVVAPVAASTPAPTPTPAPVKSITYTGPDFVFYYPDFWQINSGISSFADGYTAMLSAGQRESDTSWESVSVVETDIVPDERETDKFKRYTSMILTATKSSFNGLDVQVNTSEKLSGLEGGKVEAVGTNQGGTKIHFVGYATILKGKGYLFFAACPDVLFDGRRGLYATAASGLYIAGSPAFEALSAAQASPSPSPSPSATP